MHGAYGYRNACMQIARPQNWLLLYEPMHVHRGGSTNFNSSENIHGNANRSSNNAFDTIDLFYISFFVRVLCATRSNCLHNPCIFRESIYAHLTLEFWNSQKLAYMESSRPSLYRECRILSHVVWYKAKRSQLNMMGIVAKTSQTTFLEAKYSNCTKSL